MLHAIVKVGEGGALRADGHGTFLATHHDGGAAPCVARGYDAILGQEQHGARALNLIVYILYALHKGVALDNK